ncbi:MAG TPA: DUF2059 domain-containing protein, partial [Steroidobacteraceae bacterium]|nr:DUF2059 domain-containing protein [Steroidobacteraceae bacterium]
AARLQAAEPAIDIDSAAQVYQAAAAREQVRAALPSMPNQIKQLFARDPAAALSEPQLAAIKSAAERGFRIDVFEAPALAAFARNLDAETVAKSKEFLASDLGRRMVAADVAAAQLGEANIEKIMNGDLSTPLSPRRTQLIERLERATHSADSTAQVYLSMGEAVSVGIAIGSGQDPVAVAQRAAKSGESERAGMEQQMRMPMQRFLAYAYRNLSDSDLKHLLAFLDSAAGRHYVAAYNAAMQAGYEAMGKRTGEQLGESLRELAQAQLDAPSHGQDDSGLEPHRAPAPAIPVAPSTPAAPGEAPAPRPQR